MPPRRPSEFARLSTLLKQFRSTLANTLIPKLLCKSLIFNKHTIIYLLLSKDSAGAKDGVPSPRISSTIQPI